MTSHPRWSPAIADPSLIGWGTVAAYLLCAILLARAARRSGDERPWWLLAMALVLMLGINKQLDLQTLLTQTLRDLAVAGGWYEWRRQAQAGFIGVALIAAVLTGHRGWRIAQRSSRALRRCIIGMAILFAYILLRAANIHHVAIPGAIGGHDAWLPPLMELAGISVMAWSTRGRSRAGSHRNDD